MLLFVHVILALKVELPKALCTDKIKKCFTPRILNKLVENSISILVKTGYRVTVYACTYCIQYNKMIFAFVLQIKARSVDMGR